MTTGRSYEEVLAHCPSQATQNPDAGDAEHKAEAVASRVLGALLTDGFEAVTYADHTGDESVERRHELLEALSLRRRTESRVLATEQTS